MYLFALTFHILVLIMASLTIRWQIPANEWVLGYRELDVIAWASGQAGDP
jgi:hypothetical protein